MTLGDVEPAIRDGEAAVSYADLSGDAFLRMGFRTTHADALHQAGREAEAGRLFAEAEAMQAKQQSNHPLLYSLQGFRYCDLLLSGAERAAWRSMAADGRLTAPQPLTEARRVTERTTQTLAWFQGQIHFFPSASIT